MGDRPTEVLNKRGIFCIQNRNAPRLGTLEPYRKWPTPKALPATCPRIHWRLTVLFAGLTPLSPRHHTDPLWSERTPPLHTPSALVFIVGQPLLQHALRGPGRARTYVAIRPWAPPSTHILMIKSIGYGCLFKGGSAQQKYRIII